MYIHNWLLQSFSQYYGLASYNSHVVCLNFIHEWRDLQFKRRLRTTDIRETFSWYVYLLSEFLPEISWEEITEEILFEFCFDAWPGIRTRALRLISQHTTYYTTCQPAFQNDS